MKQTNAYAVQVNHDTTEGKGSSYDFALFTRESDAILLNDDPRFYKKYGVMGCKSDAKYNVVKREYRIFESIDEFWSQHDRETIRQRALDKLTAEERLALGV